MTEDKGNNQIPIRRSALVKGFDVKYGVTDAKFGRKIDFFERESWHTCHSRDVIFSDLIYATVRKIIVGWLLEVFHTLTRPLFM